MLKWNKPLKINAGYLNWFISSSKPESKTLSSLENNNIWEITISKGEKYIWIRGTLAISLWKIYAVFGCRHHSFSLISASFKTFSQIKVSRAGRCLFVSQTGSINSDWRIQESNQPKPEGTMSENSWLLFHSAKICEQWKDDWYEASKNKQWKKWACSAHTK